MVYKLTEHNQILIALFAIVVLCSGKLFKDYLFRGKYIEGMRVEVETDKQFRREQTAQIVGEVTFKVTLEKNLPSGGTITLSWTGAGDNDVTTSTTHTDYTATPSSLAPPTSGPVSNSVKFTASADIPANSMVTIKVKNITIYGGTKSDSALVFTISPSNGEESQNRTVKILPKIDGATQYVNPTANSIDQIKAALTAIQTRLTDKTISAPSDEDKEKYLQLQTALTALMATTYGTVKEAGQVFDSEALYNAQRTAIDFIKEEKARAIANANALKEDNSNKRRMAQINTYYTKNYEANTDVMKNIIIVSVALIILAVLRNKKIIPDSIGTLGVVFILAFGGIVIGKQVFDIIRRNDHDFDKYDWKFNEDEMNKKKLLDQQSNNSNLSDMGMGMAACYGPGCCSDGTTWSSEMGKCLPNVGTVKSGTASFSAGVLTIKFTAPSGLITNDTVTIKLPSTVDGISSLFEKASTTAPTVTGGTFTGNPDVKNEFTLKSVSDILATSQVEIIINGLQVNGSKANEISHYLTVKTSKDTNLTRIKITGV
jgi:hypothetical protein